MNPSFRCPSCGARFRTDEKFVGRRIRCPNSDCGKPIVLTLELTESKKPSTQPTTAQVRPTRSSVQAKPARATAANSEKSHRPARLPSNTTAQLAERPSQAITASSRKSRYESGNSLMPLFMGFVATLVLGGVAVGGYWWWQSGGSEDTGISGGMADSGLNPGGDGNSGAAVTAGGAAGNPGDAVLTSVVSPEILRRNAQRQQQLEEKVLPFLTKHCHDCHNEEVQEGGIEVHDLVNVDQLLNDRKKWERVYRMLNAGAMPPADYDPLPDEASRKEVTEIFYDELYDFDCTQVHHAGRSTLHRLNRAEYNNTIRDLLGISITPADKFPQDDVGEGFDNNGDVLSMPPLLMEKYLDAAAEVAAAVIDTRDYSKGGTQRFAEGNLKSSLNGSVSADGFHMLHSNGTLTADAEIVSDGKYKLRVEAKAMQAGDENAKLALQIDGKTIQEFEVKGERKNSWHEHDVTLTAGRHTLAAAFTNDYYNPEATSGGKDRNLAVRVIEMVGPEGGGTPQWHEIHRRFVTSRPSDSVSLQDAATTVLRPILYRAFRRPVTDAEISRFASLVEQTVSQHNETYEYGLSLALQAMLVSPDFVFRKEADPEGGAEERSLNDYEIASKLSYFLWSTMPDEELFQLAENKRLLDPGILRGQIERMLRDEKALALGRNFASQWLNLRNLADVRPNPDVFPDFDDALRTAMGQETILLFNTIVSEDRSIDEFLGADYSFVNERLAKHYQISGVSGDEFVRVSLEGTNRAGVLTHASVLTLTSNPSRTSPVKRGKWILENILGEAPPPPPPGVPQLEEAAKDMADLSFRERLEVHRKDPGCASCHKVMDPLGMGLENFDAVGRWRDQEGERAVDASGDLPSGEKFVGPKELISILRGRQEKFSRTLTERLMVYALGRGLEYYDKCAVDKTMDLMKQRGNRFSALVEGIVTSDPFMKRSLTRESIVGAKP